MENFINCCAIDIVKANSIIKDVFINKNTKNFYHYIFIYINIVKSPNNSIINQLFDFMKSIVINVDSVILKPNISVYQNYRNIMNDITSRFLCDDFIKRLELFDIFNREQVMLWLKDELEDNAENDRYINYYMKYCKRLLPLDKVIQHMKNNDMYKIFGIRSLRSLLCKYIMDYGIDEFIEMLIERNKKTIKDIKVVSTENTLYESVFSYNMIKIVNQNNHNHIITPPEFEFTLNSKKNVYTNVELSIEDLMEIYNLYLVLSPYLGTYKENMEKYLNSVEDDYDDFNNENNIEIEYDSF